MTRPAPAVALLLVLGSLASGCGWLAAPRPLSTDDRPRLSRPALVAAAEAACGRRARALDALPRPATDTDRHAFFASVAGLERTEADALARLRPPSRDEREFARLVSASAEVAEIAERFAAAVARDDAHARRRALADAERAAAAYDAAARRLGLACRQ